MKIDRELQKQILYVLSEHYPDGIYEPVLTGVLDKVTGGVLLANLIYLQQHGLADSGYKRQDYLGGQTSWHQLAESTITAAGMDFIADDGGLGAILNTVTVRLDAGQFAELLATKVENLPGVPLKERSELAKAIRRMPAIAVEKLTEKMLDWTVDHAGDALPLIRATIALAT